MEPAKILVVDDDPAIRSLIVRFLGRKNYHIEAAADGATGKAIFERLHPELVILDVNLPDTSGYTLCEQMQAIEDVFVLMLTSRDDTADKIQGFSKGADDYITKPFDLQELEYRVGAMLRRGRKIAPAVPASLPVVESLRIGEMSIDPTRREVTIADQLITFTALEFDLLFFFAHHPGRVWRRSELIQEVWRYDHTGDKRVVDVHIGQIRRKLEQAGLVSATIKTVRGVGYRFELLDSYASPPLVQG